MKEHIRLLVLADFHHNFYGSRRERRGEGAEGKVFTGPDMLKRLDAVLEEKSGAVDHIIIAGDITNRGFEHEYPPIANILKSRCAESLSVVPGNHDMCTNPFTNVTRRKFQRRFASHFGGQMSGAGKSQEMNFPYLKFIDKDTAIIGIDTTVGILDRLKHTFLWFSASVGYVGEEQLESMVKMAAGAGQSRKFIVLIMHHDPFVKQNPWTQLCGIRKFKKTIDEISAKSRLIMICGHDHRGRIDYYNENILHIQPPAFCGRRASDKGLFYDVTINNDLSYTLNK